MIDEQRLQEIEAMAILAGDRAIIHVEGDLAGIHALQMVLGRDIPDLVAALREAQERIAELEERRFESEQAGLERGEVD